MKCLYLLLRSLISAVDTFTMYAPFLIHQILFPYHYYLLILLLLSLSNQRKIYENLRFLLLYPMFSSINVINLKGEIDFSTIYIPLDVHNQRVCPVECLKYESLNDRLIILQWKQSITNLLNNGHRSQRNQNGHWASFRYKSILRVLGKKLWRCSCSES